jgi:hypothetical protein
MRKDKHQEIEKNDGHHELKALQEALGSYYFNKLLAEPFGLSARHFYVRAISWI